MPQRTRAVLLSAILLGGCRDAATTPVDEHPPLTVLTPPCEAPAPLNGKPNTSEPRHLVVYKAGVDPGSETTRLARVHGFTTTHVFRAGTGGFAAALTPRLVAAIRCEASVNLVEYDLRMTIANGEGS